MKNLVFLNQSTVSSLEEIYEEQLNETTSKKHGNKKKKEKLRRVYNGITILVLEK